jgi:hypothetical protein
MPSRSQRRAARAYQQCQLLAHVLWRASTPSSAAERARRLPVRSSQSVPIVRVAAPATASDHAEMSAPDGDTFERRLCHWGRIDGLPSSVWLAGAPGFGVLGRGALGRELASTIAHGCAVHHDPHGRMGRDSFLELAAPARCDGTPLAPPRRLSSDAARRGFAVAVRSQPRAPLVSRSAGACHLGAD